MKLGTFENLVLAFVCSIPSFGCSFDTDGQGEGVRPSSAATGSSAESACFADVARYPTNKEDFQNLLYGHRGFLDVYDGYKHLGHDVIYSEGTSIHPIACGTVKFYGQAGGYGTLAAVVEHKLRATMQSENGDGASVSVKTFLSIYGHMRKESLSWKVGDNINPEDVIGFTQSDYLNGDGTEHLHLGVRLQSADQAKASDPSWFRGNDTEGAGFYKKYFADPKDFLPSLMVHLGDDSAAGWSDSYLPAHYPVGTLLRDKFSSEYWIVVGEDRIMNASGFSVLPRECAVNVEPDVVACYWQTQFDPLALYLDSKVVKFQGEPQVYQLFPGKGYSPTKYRTFLSYESFLSWGYKDGDIQSYPLSKKTAVLGGLENSGLVGMMPGALVKGMAQSEVAAANQSGQRIPIFDWDLFQSMGYKAECVYEVEGSTLDAVGGTRSDELITINYAAQCLAHATGNKCQPGATSSCSCGSGISGTQTCASDGESYGACDCPGINGPGGSEGTDVCDDVVNRFCATNETRFCACPGGIQGAQTCKVDCSGWETCACPEPYDAGPGAGGGSGSEGVGGAGGLGGSAQNDSGPNPACVPGQQVVCACLGGFSGIQVCAADGMSLGPCTCASGSGGANGAGGANGTGGASNGAGGAAIGSGGSPAGTGGSSQPDPDSECQQYGVSGQTTFIVRAPVASGKSLSIFGWIDYPGWCGVSDTPWGGWAWSQPGVGEMVFQKGQAFQGAKYIFAPGVSSASNQSQDAWYCEQASCPVGTYVVCNGKVEACRLQNGLLTGGAAYIPNQSGWQNIQCTLN